MLTDMVASGTLPPLEERLPVTRKVIVPTNEIGKYGGTMRAFMLNETDPWAAHNPSQNFGFVHVPRDLVPFVKGLPMYGWEPYLCDSFEWNDDATQFTVHMHKGMKWSDGEPFTAEDIRFYWDDIQFNEDFMKSPSVSLRPQGQPMSLDTPDDYTLVFKMPVPYPAFPFLVLRSNDLVRYPKHWMAPVHPKYTPGAEYTALQEKSTHARQHTGTPMVSPWFIGKNEPTVGITMERNPYCCAIDTEGNQLPYVDYYFFPMVGTQENAVLKAVAGEIDVAERNIQLFDQLQTLKENQERGNYEVLFWEGTSFTQANIITFNHAIHGEGQEELFEMVRNKEFRHALSIAIDREDINQTLYFGLGRPTSYALNSASPYYNDEMAEVCMQYAEYDPDKAGEMLDALGLEMGADGMRTFPSGKPVTLIVDAATEITMHARVAEMVVNIWREVGIDARLNLVQRSVVYERWGTLENQCWVFGCDAQQIPLLRPTQPILTPKENGRSMRPEDYEEMPGWVAEKGPPEVAEEMSKLVEAIFAETDPEVSMRLHRELAKFKVEWQHDIYLMADLPIMIIRHNRMGNIPDVGISLQNVIYESPEQFYIKE